MSTSKIAIKNHSKVIKECLVSVSSVKKEWDGTNNTLIQLVTTWLNERQTLKYVHLTPSVHSHHYLIVSI